MAGDLEPAKPRTELVWNSGTLSPLLPSQPLHFSIHETGKQLSDRSVLEAGAKQAIQKGCSLFGRELDEATRHWYEQLYLL